VSGGPAVATSGLRCPACGWSPGPDEPHPFRCANAGTDDGDHVLAIEAAALGSGPAILGDPGEVNPFVRHRHGLWSHRFATAHGMADTDWVALVRELDDAIAAVDGHGFRATPFTAHPALSDRLGVTVLVKDETGNVGGSHKGRHLMGIMLHLLAFERVVLGWRTPQPADRRRLAIASCGNAALGAAVVAHAARWPLDVFVPPWADPAVVEALDRHGATITVCPRQEGDRPGDPCVHRFRDAVAAGAVPFGCQGPDNALALDGGRTLAFEMVASGLAVDRIVVQVGGGALASSLAQGWLAAAGHLPRLHAVQTEGGHPLTRAWDAFVAGGRDLADAVHHRSRHMWAWETEPRSAAAGILDDETYDWAAVVAGMDTSGGDPIVATEAAVLEAARIGPELTGIPADATGTAGLAGLLTLLADPDPARRPAATERVVVLFTGRRR
jgi:threonine synthase